MDGLGIEMQQFLARQFGEHLQHLTLQPLHQLERDIEEIAGATGGVEDTHPGQPAMEIAHPLHGGAGIVCPLGLHRAQHLGPVVA